MTKQRLCSRLMGIPTGKHGADSSRKIPYYVTGFFDSGFFGYLLDSAKISENKFSIVINHCVD